MSLVFPLAIVLATTNVLAYHDPDLNYHINQLQSLHNCGQGYTYPAPAVQLTTTGVKPVAAPPAALAQPFTPSYQYSQRLLYQPPRVAYSTEQGASITTNPNNYAAQTVYSAGQKEIHGYATTAGLSSSASMRTVTPLATYAQAPIIAKVTAAPLVAKFTLAPAKTTYASQNYLSQEESFASSGSLAKASLNSQNIIHAGGPVVSQVYAAPTVRYAASPALRIQQVSQGTPATQYSVAAPVVAHYAQTNLIPSVGKAAYTAPTQYSTAGQISASSGSSYISYSRPLVAQYSTSIGSRYRAPSIQYSAPTIINHPAPALSQYYSAPSVIQYSSRNAASAQRYSVGQSASVGVISTPGYTVAPHTAPSISAPAAVKNIHSDFLENYDAHPKYTFEYGVNDPHTGDIKQQKEERDGELVKGQYSLVEADGSVRTVNYVADWETGFHADVQNSKYNHY